MDEIKINQIKIDKANEESLADFNNGKKDFRWGKFFLGVGAILATDVVVGLALFNIISGLQGLIFALFVLPASAILGFFLWLIFKDRNRSMAIGLLVGGTIPFVLLFLFTGGCGLLSH